MTPPTPARPIYDDPMGHLARIWSIANELDTADEWLAASVRLIHLAIGLPDFDALAYYQAAALAIERSRMAI